MQEHDANKVESAAKGSIRLPYTKPQLRNWGRLIDVVATKSGLLGDGHGNSYKTTQQG